MRKPLLLCPLVGLLACNSNDAPTSASETDSASTSTSTADASTAESTAAESSTSTPTTSATSEAASTTDAPALVVTTEIVRYMQQPMVADIVVTTNIPTDAIDLTHTSDPGVIIAPIAVDGLTTTFRVRGLAPDTNHELAYVIDGSEGTVPFITYPPLIGFIPKFKVTGGPVDPAVPYRMFDLIPFPAFTTASIFMVDPAGTTRWHIGGPSTMTPGPEGVYTAVQLRDDGTVMYLHNHTMWIRDELGEPLLELTDDMLGVLGLHHELLQLPGGNFMALAFSFQDIDYGKDGVRTTAGDRIVEFTPEGELVWSWDAFDHLDPQRIVEPFATAILVHPETLEQTFDWTHGNAIVHDPETDTLLLSLRHQDWILCIDHKTGEVLWKLGKGGDFALLGADKFFFHQHTPEWQKDGSLLLYDNAVGDPDVAPEAVQSRARRYQLDLVKMTATEVWRDDGEPIVSTFAGNADRLPGGRILVTDSSITTADNLYARLRELDDAATPQVQWTLTTPDTSFAYRGTAHERLVGQSAP